jgi:hypothetical protein
MASTQLTRARVEDLVRKSLGITDLSDTQRLVAALARRYPELDAKERAVSQGLLGGTGATVSATPVGSGVTLRLAERARQYLEADRHALATEEDLRARREEFQGTGDKMLYEFEEGMRAARLADDVTRQARVLVAVNKLIDIAHALRLVSFEYVCNGRCVLRRAAASVDRAVSVILQSAGEAVLAAADGFIGAGAGRVTELTEYANRATSSLTTLILGGEETGPGDVAALATLRTQLRETGQDSLRYYLVPSTLADVLADIIASASSGGDASVRRRRKATVAAEVNDLVRLVAQIKAQLPSEDPSAQPKDTAYTPALLGLRNALGAFVDEYRAEGGTNRLVFFAAPFGYDPAELGDEGKVWTVLTALVTERTKLRAAWEPKALEVRSLTDVEIDGPGVIEEAIAGLDRILVGAVSPTTASGVDALRNVLLRQWAWTVSLVKAPADPAKAFSIGPYTAGWTTDGDGAIAYSAGNTVVLTLPKGELSDGAVATIPAALQDILKLGTADSKPTGSVPAAFDNILKVTQ